MAHITFVHGIANKPPADDLLAIWQRTLAQASEPVPLGDLGVTASIVYWADLMYERPDADLAAHEGVLENTVAAVDASGGAQAPVPATAEEAAFLDALRRHLTTKDDATLAALAAAPPGAQAEAAGVGAAALERVPLPWFLKKPFMEAFLRDVHHYLFDVEFGPPGRPHVRIQQSIRKRFLDALAAPGVSRPHVVVSHSMGTVIAYDCLKRLSGCAPVDGLITIGSPLGLDEVQDKLQPGWSSADGFPHERLEGRWFNFYDRLDPVCGFDPQLANDFGHGGKTVVIDQVVQNPGAWRHSATKYLRQPVFGQALRQLLGR
jgi:hypothetical protein